ncbi:hypothetical protein BJ875DRAFT_478541 [Amylocarpus encephaloides]|uniref:Uncharacterized protein n=1 Tax=Amylocarpus encephaloides TaxID=45428 RepID=A0A9P7Y6A0_9HELO|nr:hypothetical protein BJ875DRAFT_478541 [Amylocarpus encephaloides]
MKCSDLQSLIVIAFDDFRTHRLGYQCFNRHNESCVTILPLDHCLDRPKMAPPSTTPQQAQNDNARKQAQLIHTASIAVVVLCPIVLALPPRKLDAYSAALVSLTFVGGNQLAQEYTGRSILTRIQHFGTERPPRAEAPIPISENALAQSMQERIALGKDKMSGKPNSEPFTKDGAALSSQILDEVARKQIIDGQKRIAKPAWKEERDRKEKEMLEEGKGYGDLISEQIWEVWNWGSDKTEQVKEKDKKVDEEKEQSQKGDR